MTARLDRPRALTRKQFLRNKVDDEICYGIDPHINVADRALRSGELLKLRIESNGCITATYEN